MRVLNEFRQQNKQPVQQAKVVSDKKAPKPEIIDKALKLAEKGKYFKLESPFGHQIEFHYGIKLEQITKSKLCT